MTLNVLTPKIIQSQEIIKTHLQIYQHMNQIHMQYIYQFQIQFESKIDEVDLESY